MGYKQITLKLRPAYTEEDLSAAISKKLGLKEYFHTIRKKSLDARNRANIHWQLTVDVSSKEIKNKESYQDVPVLEIPYENHKKKIIVVGSGPAGFFSALILQKAGFNVLLLERGTDVHKREQGIKTFETTGVFDPLSNYAFGEGGAGTFSDGKLTSRSKHISKEKKFIIDNYIQAGAPEEIAYLSHPHIGSNNLKKIVKKLRADLINAGGKISFETFVQDINVKSGKVVSVLTDKKDEISADIVLFATGHSAYETYKMLIAKGVVFRTKNFALGYRVEHEQELINIAQWKKKELAGIKAAEYRLSVQANKDFSVYTFCMCPGGSIIPSTAYSQRNIVNGMSMYQRNGKFANAGCVAGIDLNKLLGKEISALEAIDWLDSLEKSFYDHCPKYKVPACSIMDFMKKDLSGKKIDTSYPLGAKEAPLWQMLPFKVSDAISLALKDFSNKIRGFEKGNIMGLESKTSAVIQVVRDKQGLCEGFSNLYMIGEGSGYAGGIISSAADGIRSAMAIIEKEK